MIIIINYYNIFNKKKMLEMNDLDIIYTYINFFFLFFYVLNMHYYETYAFCKILYIYIKAH